jgi:hypothetical protein
MKMIENRLRKIIKEAVMSELNLMPQYADKVRREEKPKREDKGYIAYGLMGVIRPFLMNELEMSQEEIGMKHAELDECIYNMVDIIMR